MPNAHDLIGEQEENRRDEDHHEHHHSGDGRLLARRPGDLLPLGPHFLQELEWVDLRHGSTVGIWLPNKSFPTRLSGGDRNSRPFWGMFAAEVRHRAAGDREASYCQPPKPSSAEALVGVEAARRHPSSLVGVLIGGP